MRLNIKTERAIYKGLSAIIGNISAGYFGAIFIVPTLIKLRSLSDILLLIFDFLMGILLLVLTIVFERRSL
jgi:hypothetical protein